MGARRGRGLLHRWNQLFVVWVLGFSAVAYMAPWTFAWFRPAIVPGLGVIMLGMGVTLTPRDFARVARRWPAVGLAALAQFGIMPAAAFAVARILSLPPELELGVLLVAACPGGTASNLIAYLAGADVALSISMTAVSTLLSPLVTPALLELWAGAAIAIPFPSQALTIARVVAIPVVLGLALRLGLERSGRRSMVDGLLEVFPAVSVLFIVLIVACIVALNAERMTAFGPAVVGAVVLVNGAGLGLGYLAARLARLDRPAARAVAIEVGMQNSGLGVALATAFFTPPVALPSAFFSLWHNVSGPALASWWRRSRPGAAGRAEGGTLG